MREAAEIAKQYRMTAMIEFVRTSPFVSTLSTSLKMTREAAHPNMRPMLDCYHFWSGLSKFEDLDSDPPGRDWTCAFPGRARHAARAFG